MKSLHPEQDDVFGEFHYYDFIAGPAHFWGIDTNWIVRYLKSAESTELMEWGGTIGDTDRPWVFAFGHHPILSNGSHGNAGSYNDTGINLWPGEALKGFLDDHVIGTADLYLSGHDHNLSFFPSAGPDGDGTANLVSGAAAKCRERGDRELNPGTAEEGSGVTATYEHYGYGFTIVRATRTELEVTMFGEGKEPWTARRTVGSQEWTIDGGAPPIDREGYCD